MAFAGHHAFLGAQVPHLDVGVQAAADQVGRLASLSLASDALHLAQVFFEVHSD